MTYTASTHLWVGPQGYLKDQAYKKISQHYCVSSGCGTCAVCAQIKQEQFYGMLVVHAPKNRYTRVDFDAVFAACALARPAQEPLFCIIESADTLSPACANSLLKVLEEPPANWHWLLLTDRATDMLPTLLSRCMVTRFDAHVDVVEHELYTQLTGARFDTLAFHAVLERHKMSELQAVLLYDKIVAFWSDKAVHTIRYAPLAQWLHNFLHYQPMPGSSKFFWRTVFVHMQALVERG